MSKSSSKEKKPALADWEVNLTSYEGNVVTIPGSRWRRDEAGGYTFYDHAGLLWDFAPGTVAHVRRLATLVPDPRARQEAEDARQALARKLAGGDPGPIEVGKP